MKIFFGYMIGCLVIGAVMWRHRGPFKLILMLGMAVMVCAIYFFTNSI